MSNLNFFQKEIARVRASRPKEAVNIFLENLPRMSTDDEISLMGRKRLNQALDLEDYDDNQFIKTSLFILGVSAILFFPWAALTPITQVVEASGEVVPKGSVTIVQHLEGGIVSSVLVNNGQSVSEGDTLLTLNPKIINSEYLALQARLDALKLQQQRLQAALKDKDVLSGDNSLEAVSNNAKKIAIAQQDLLKIRQQNTQDQVDSAEAVILEKKAEVDGLNRQLSEFTKQRDMWASLVRDGASSKLQLSSAQAKVEEVTGARNEAMKALSQAKSNLKSVKSGLKLEQSSLIASLTNEEAIVSENIKKIRFELDRTNIKAPVSGIISDLRYLTSGSVITPGDIVASVVPTNTLKLVEARVPAAKISSVKVGQSVEINVLPYDSTMYGTIPGKVIRISGNSVKDPIDNSFYFLATIELERQYINASESKYPVQVGMPVVAGIKGKQRNLLAYLFQPFLRTIKGSFSE